MIELNNSANHSGGVGRGAASPRDRTEQDEERRAPPNRGRGVWEGAQLHQTEAGGVERNAARQLAVREPRARNGNSGSGIRDLGFGIRDSALGARSSRARNWDSGFGNSGFGIRDWVPGSSTARSLELNKNNEERRAPSNIGGGPP